MKFKKRWIILVILLGLLKSLYASASIIPRAQNEAPGQRMLNEAAGHQDQKIVLSPFFLLQRKDARAWIERVIVTLAVTLPKNCRQDDLTCPASRKIIYELLQSQEQEVDLQSQVRAILSRIMGINLDASMQISRSTIIVH
jgi:hypothetical protein